MTDDEIAAGLAANRERDQQVWRHRGGDAETWSAIDAAHYDVPRLLAAVDAALALPARWAAKDLHLPSSVLTEDRGWVRAECAGGLRAAILAGLTGDEASRD